MRKFFASVLAIFLFVGAANAQSPVTISVDSVSATTISAHFTKSESCTEYSFMIAEPGSLDPWFQMMGATLEDLIPMWGIHATADTSYTWTELAASTDQIIYVLANTPTGNVLDSVVTATLTIGGSGVSLIAIEVSEITESSARVVCTANEETGVFYDQLIEKTFFEEIGTDSAIAIVKESMFPQYQVDDWTWFGLTPNTEYYALAIGQNADGQWGQLAMQSFATLESTEGITLVDANGIRVYPNPTTDMVTVSLGGQAVDMVELYDMAGHKILSASASDRHEVQLDMANLPLGSYIVRVAQKGRHGQSAVVVKK